MATVTTDVIDGTRGNLTVNGWELERRAIVSGVTGTGHTRIINAADDAGMPNIGDAHPGRSACVLVRIEPEAVSSEEVTFRLYYSDRGLAEFGWAPDTIQGNASVGQTETNMDAAGVPLLTTYSYPSDYPYGDQLRGQAVTACGRVPLLAPETSITISRWEYTNPSASAREFIGTVNQGPCSIDTLASARTWLCSDISWVSRNQGTSYYVTYTFQYRPDTWDSTVTFVDAVTREVPPDILTNDSYADSIATYQMYTMKDFDVLGL
jgi:hypothetical protein